MIKLIVGLRNPGPAYAETRHNAGAWFVLAWSQEIKASFRTEKKFEAEISSCMLEQTQRHFVLPSTYMNESGTSVQRIAHFYRIESHEILVVHDDLDLPAGVIRLKTGGGHGGHNGIRDVILHLGTTAFHRLRIGIGHPGEKSKVHDFVLSKPTVDEREKIHRQITHALTYSMQLLEGSLSIVMNELNRGS